MVPNFPQKTGTMTGQSTVLRSTAGVGGGGGMVGGAAASPI